jgi:hypothetical protein
MKAPPFAWRAPLKKDSESGTGFRRFELLPPRFVFEFLQALRNLLGISTALS